MASNEPMMAGVAGRYAMALLDTAREENQLSDVERDIDTISQMIDESEDMRRLVRSPVFSAEDQTRAIEAVLSKAGTAQLTTNFFKLLVRNRRLFATHDIIRAFKALAAEARGEVQAEVASAIALNDVQLNELRETLKASVGKDVTLETKVDPSLLGGLVVKIGSRMIDSSLKTKIATLKTRMKEVG
ncbi:MAG: F0F1 ATP synthase subunit delta [Alphaproteobacteria bacterium]|nr:F0F1 ATP synthase subunit delta [Alphaproteobacteria bacterium]